MLMIKKSAVYLISYIRYIVEYRNFKKQAEEETRRFPLLWKDRYPILSDKTATTDFDRHYIYHTAWAARILAEFRPICHVDISSALQFSTIVSAFIPVDFYDYRPADIELNNFTAGHVDLQALPFPTDSITSLSCMHVVEHVGLGRYGDPLDPAGDLKAIVELKRVLAVDGTLLFVVPIGKARVMFNAHRVYSFGQILEYFSDLALEEFTLIPDNPVCGGLIRYSSQELADAQSYGCGCFRFKKNASRQVFKGESPCFSG